jgi:hypothetical protein
MDNLAVTQSFKIVCIFMDARLEWGGFLGF